MCGIFTLINCPFQHKKLFIETQFEKGKGRGPEHSTLTYNENNYIQGFHRLAINGLNELSNQPLNYEECSLICNGEIYNYKELYQMMNITPNTESDCEVIIHLYKKYGIEHTLRLLDGVFAFVLITPNNIYVARDPYGVRPLYYVSKKVSSNICRWDECDDYEEDYDCYGFASEMKCLINLFKGCKVQHFEPGTYLTFDKTISPNRDKNIIWTYKNKSIYHIPNFSYSYNLERDNFKYLIPNILNNLYRQLYSAVKKRYLSTERPIACLLSGGLDSSLIASIVCDIHKKLGKDPKQIETYSIGLFDSEDIKYARIVAEHIGSKHTEIILTEDEFIDAIPEVIYAIESYDVTTVRASIGNYLIGKYIKEHSEAKVIFNGDGSDELCGGYLYMSKCPDNLEYDKETLRLLKDIHMFDVLRSDKSISSHGLEPRTPFLDKSFVNYYLSIPIELRNHNNNQNIEKYLLRNAFRNTGLLPNEILWRKKEAFSDGVSNKGKSLYIIIQEYIEEKYNEEQYIKYDKKEKEKHYYKSLFETYYPNQMHIIPYYWMPKYVISNDPSARTLSIYNIKDGIKTIDT
jgi:asparagine synthase (glutamine-hydrolysing)